MDLTSRSVLVKTGVTGTSTADEVVALIGHLPGSGRRTPDATAGPAGPQHIKKMPHSKPAAATIGQSLPVPGKDMLQVRPPHPSAESAFS